MGPLDPTRTPSSRAQERENARIQAFKLVVDVQAAVYGASEAIDRLLDDALAEGWPEVVRAGIFAAAVAAVALDYKHGLPAIERLLAQADADGDHAMVALALAMRSSLDTTGEHQSAALDADADLARATVLLESAHGDELTRMTAHNECAQAFGDRWLWELADEQYAAALSLAPSEPPAWLPFVLPAIVYNQAEMQVDWACAQRQLGDDEGVAERWQTWETTMATAVGVELPHLWRTELNALGCLLGAIAGHDTGEEAQAQLAALSPDEHVRAWPLGHLWLAMALQRTTSGHLAEAAEATEAALMNIDPHGSPDTYDLALSVAAELEGRGGHAVGLRYGRRQLERRSANRLAALGSMRSRLQAERLHSEHDLLSRHAHLDDLTGLSNRRGFDRYLAALDHQGIDAVAILLVDLDGFKAVNDHYGHATGDAVLIAVAGVLQTSVRQVDCAVRLGGDEFAVVLASANLEVARMRAEAVVGTVRQHPWAGMAPDLNVSISVGLAAGPSSSMRELIAAADSALYEAKAAGGHRIISRQLPARASKGRDPTEETLT
ncbi:MAG: GGDEF domain-containing protein [Acidimicrobiales bacterium]